MSNFNEDMSTPSGGVIRIVSDGLGRVIQRFRRFEAQIEKANDEISKEVAELLLLNIRDELSGKPERPQPQTGALRDSWTLFSPGEDGKYEVRSSSDYAKRRNYGFMGFDSLGRLYTDPGTGFLEAAEANTNAQKLRIVMDVYKRKVVG